MYREKFQQGCLSIFYSIGSKPLDLWKIEGNSGHVKRIIDDDINSMALEIIGTNVSTMFIRIPRCLKEPLGIKLPFLVLLVKNMRKFFSFQVEIIDDTKFRRRFRFSNFQSKTNVKPFCTQMPLAMSPGWNQIHFNLADFTRKAYGTNYLETVRIQVHANIRIRRIYFTDRLYKEDELPSEYKIMITKRGTTKAGPKKAQPKGRPPSPEKICISSCCQEEINETKLETKEEEEKKE